MKTEIISIIDRSGSMASIANDAIGGFNTFLTDQQSVPGEARMSLVIFDDQYDVLYAGKPLREAEQLTRVTFVPRGPTALLDAIGRTLNEQGKRIKSDGWADKVIVCVLTDGEENASREFTAPTVKEMVQKAEAQGWTFVFLAANQDAFATGAQYGFNAKHTVNFVASPQGTQDAYDKMSATTRTLRSTPTNP